MLQLYSNIKRLRKLNNMSQQALAEAVGYSGKSMIAQIENGRVDLSASMISKFAEVFQVNEIDLMESETIIDSFKVNKLNREAAELHARFENLPAEKKASLLDYLKYLESDS